MPFNPITGLQGALGTPVPGSALLGPGDQSLINQGAGDYLFKKALKDELTDRMARAQATGASPGELGALKTMLGSASEDVGDPGTTPTSPLGVQAQSVRDINAKNQAANLAGFPDAVTQSKYEQVQAERKAQQPLEMTREEQAGQTARNAATIAGQANIERMKEEAQKASNERELQFVREQQESGQLEPGTTIGFGQGRSFKTPGIAPMPSGKAGEDFATIKNNLARQISAPSFEDKAWDRISNLLGMSSLGTQADIQSNISKLDAARPGWFKELPPGDPIRAYMEQHGITKAKAAPGTATGAKRQQAINLLRDQAGVTNPSEEQIQAAISQIP